jgi:hypothetical protein
MKDISVITLLNAVTYRDKNSNGDYYTMEESGITLTKVIKRNGSKLPANYPKYFSLGSSYNPETLKELFPILKNLGSSPKTLVVRGSFDGFSEGDKVRRLAENMSDVGSNIIAIDVDEVMLPDYISKTDLKAQGEWVCNLLHHCYPNEFPDDMGFIAQGSSSAGFSGDIKLHLWLQNYVKVTQPQLRNLFSRVNYLYKKNKNTNKNLVDIALYHPAQAHYTAYPIFEDARDDPFREKPRTVMSFGNECYIPGDYPVHIAPVKLSEVETDGFHRKVRGTHIMSPAVQKKYDLLIDWHSSESGLRTKLLSLFHSAVQDQFCTTELMRLLKPIISGKRSEEVVDDYFHQGTVSALGNIKALSDRSIPEMCKGLELNTLDGGSHEKYLQFRDIFPADSVTFLKATLGTGKTNTIADWLQNGKIKGKVLAITDTSALVESNAERFGAGDFRTAEARLQFAAGTISRLSGTLHSLPKIREFIDDFDFVFIDEADSVMNNLLFAAIISEEKKQEILTVLHELLMRTDRVVISDGDISQETVNCYVELMDGQRDLNRVDFKRENLKGVTAYKHLKESSFWGAVQGHLELGDKCLVVTDASPNKLNEYYHTFSRVCPEKKIAVVHSASKMDVEVRDIVNRTTQALEEKKIDLLLSSPSITNGVDFNYFDTVFVLTTTDNQTPNMRFQAMMRERQPETIHYFFHNKRKFTTGYSGKEFDKSFTNYARKEFSLRREREFQTYIATFNYYLLSSGASIAVLDDCFESPKSPDDILIARDERINAILNAGPNSNLERHNDAFAERNMLRYFYEVPPNEELAWDTVGDWIDEKPHVKAEYFYKIFHIIWPYLSRASTSDIVKMLKDKGSQFYLATGESVQGGENKAKTVLRRCNIVPECPESLERALTYLRKHCEVTDGASMPDELIQYEEVAKDL